MRPKLSDSELSKTIILTASAFAVSGVITVGAAHASDIESENGKIGMPGRTIAMSNLPGLSRPSANATIDSSTASDTGESDSVAGSDAADIADKAKNFVPPDKRAAARKFFSQSMALKKQGDSGGALIGFLKATREDPTLLDAYYEQAIIFREKGFHKLAASRLEQALAIKPKFQKARLLLATVKLEQGNVPDAVQELGKTLGLDDGNRKSKEKLQTLKDDEPLPPPMILQALHPVMPVATFAQPQKAVEAPPPLSTETAKSTEAAKSTTGETFRSIDLTTFDLAPAANSKNGALDPTSASDLKQQKTAVKPKKARRGTRQRIRELIARKRKKYGRYSKQKQPKRWIAKIFSVPEPLRFLSKQGSPEKTAADNELQPRAVSDETQTKGKPGKPFNAPMGKSTQELAQKTTKESTGKWFGREASSKEPARKEMSAKELERKFETAVAQTFSENKKSTASDDAHSKSRWDWHRPLTPRESKDDKANQEFERARKTASAYRPSNAPYEPELWKRGPVEKRDSSGSETDAFKLPDHGSPKSGWLGITALASSKLPAVTSENTSEVAAAPPAEAPDEDEWTKRLRDLNENGTGTLKKGEAFMFSEDTGEAVLFLADGQKIRRIIANPVSSDELLKLRRPDVLVPKELYYDTSLLGKVVPPIPAPPPPAAASPNSVSPAPAFKMEDLVGGSDGFFGWLKGLVHF